MNKINKYWPFTTLFPFRGRIATKYDCMTFGAATSVRGQEFLKAVLI